MPCNPPSLYKHQNNWYDGHRLLILRLCFKEMMFILQTKPFDIDNWSSAQIVTMTTRVEVKENTINIKGDGFLKIKHLMVSKTSLATCKRQNIFGKSSQKLAGFRLIV